MVKVCAHYCGTIIMIGEFETREQANEFMKHSYLMHYVDELVNATEDELIYPDEMFIEEDEIPFCEVEPALSDDLPF